jgi:exonuclease III
MTTNNNLNIYFSAINVNSMNVSTLGSSNAKTYLKIEGITRRRPDVILLSDVRAKDKGVELKKLMGLTRNGCYKLYLNSSKESRGVGIAIKRSIAHEIYSTIIDNAENYILLDVKLKGRRVTIGCVYGPNENNPEF